MLENLHVKNLALIDEIEVDFQPGLNILTGETGAGKSILLGSVNLALGGKYSADMLRTGAKFGLVELTFTIENEKLEKQLEAMDIYPEDGRIVLNRKLMEGRSVSKINGETVNMTTLREVACMLIDIHEQHVHQSLLHKRNHLVFLDLYAKDKIEPLKEKVAKAYHAYTDYQKKLENFSMDERERQKEISWQNLRFMRLKRQIFRTEKMKIWNSFIREWHQVRKSQKQSAKLINIPVKTLLVMQVIT